MAYKEVTMLKMEVPMGIDWLSKANKYVENQYEYIKSDFGEPRLQQIKNFDESFVKEFDFICLGCHSNISHQQ